MAAPAPAFPSGKMEQKWVLGASFHSSVTQLGYVHGDTSSFPPQASMNCSGQSLLILQKLFLDSRETQPRGRHGLAMLLLWLPHAAPSAPLLLLAEAALASHPASSRRSLQVFEVHD